MKKFLKNNKAVVAELITYFVMLILGIITILFPLIGIDNILVYSSLIFLILAFFSFGGYFYTKENKVNYELLIFSLICILLASCLLAVSSSRSGNILATAFLAFTVLTTINRIYHIIMLKRRDNELYLLRSIALILILFVSVLSIQNFYRSYNDVETVIIGYYFLTYGMISFAEMILFVTLNPFAFKKFVDGDNSNNKKLKRIDKLDSSINKIDRIVKNIDEKKLHKK